MTHLINRGIVVILVSACFLLMVQVLVNAGNGKANSVGSTTSFTAQVPALPLTASLTLSAEPVVNQPVILFITVGTTVEAPEMSVELILPDGASVVDGATQWTLALQAGQTDTISTTLQFGLPGEQELFVNLQQPIDEFNTHLGEGGMRVIVAEASTVSVTQSPLPQPTLSPAQEGEQQVTIDQPAPEAPPVPPQPTADPEGQQPVRLPGNCATAGLLGLAGVWIVNGQRRSNRKDERR